MNPVQRLLHPLPPRPRGIASPAAAPSFDAHRWLIESGIRGVGRDAGAIRRQYDVRLGLYSDFYPEVTAYALQLHLRLAGTDRHGLDWRAALESGEWLLRAQSSAPPPACGAFAHAMRDGKPAGGWFAFDTAIIGHAMLELALATHRPDFTRTAERCANWVLGLQQANGGFRAFVGPAQPVGWASDQCCLHGKHALLLGALWRHGGERRYRESGRRLLDWLLGLQDKEGRIDAFSRAGYGMLHTQCYAIEGLLAGASWLDHPRAGEAAVRGARYLATCQRPSGAMPRYRGRGAVLHLQRSGARFPRFRAAVAPADAGVTAQAVRVWTWVQRQYGEDHAEAIGRGLDWLSCHRIVSADPKIAGGLYAGVDEVFGLRRSEPWLYPWVSIFEIDAHRLQHEGQSAPDYF